MGDDFIHEITFALLASLLLSACVDAPPTTPQIGRDPAGRELGLDGDAAPHFAATNGGRPSTIRRSTGWRHR